MCLQEHSYRNERHYVLKYKSREKIKRLPSEPDAALFQTSHRTMGRDDFISSRPREIYPGKGSRGSDC